MIIKTIKNVYTAEEARNIVSSTDRRVDIVKMTEIYYPYYRMRYKILVGNKTWNKLKKLSDCIVDLVDGRTSQGIGEPLYEEVEIKNHEALPINFMKDNCYKKGHDFVLKLFLNKGKLLHVPSLEVISEETFYKKFYIANCKNKEQQYYFVMVDSIEGEISILDT